MTKPIILTSFLALILIWITSCRKSEASEKTGTYYGIEINKAFHAEDSTTIYDTLLVSYKLTYQKGDYILNTSFWSHVIPYKELKDNHFEEADSKAQSSYDILINGDSLFYEYKNFDDISHDLISTDFKGKKQ